MKHPYLLEHHFDTEVGRLKITSRCVFMKDEACPHGTAEILMWLEKTFGKLLIGAE